MRPWYYTFTRTLVFLATRWAAILAGCVAAYATWLAISYANQPLLELNAFRQTQTALTSYWMVREGWQLAYQTPVGGYPWSIPFEFPLYQSLVALVAWLGRFPLDPVGRLISFAFLLGCAWPAQQIARRLAFSPQVAWIFCALLWSSPYYLYWARTFSIETLAIFLMLAAIPYALDLAQPNPNLKTALFASLFATLGMLQKITTGAPVVMVMGLVVMATVFGRSGAKLPTARQIAAFLIAFLPPIVAGLAWTYYTDLVKEANALGRELTSQKLMQWNFGTIEQRFDVEQLKVIFWDRILSNNVAGFIGPLLLAAAFIFGPNRVRMFLLVALILLILPIFIFFGLHFNHEYYQASCVVFLIAALAAACAFVPPRPALWRYAIIPVIVAMVLVNYQTFTNTYAVSESAPRSFFIENSTDNPNFYLAVAEVVRRYSPEDSGIVVFGADWNSTIAYYSQRKALTVPNWAIYDAAWQNPSAFLGGKQLGALVFCPGGKGVNFKRIMERPDVSSRPTLFNVNGCFIWFPHLFVLHQTQGGVCQGSIDTVRRGAQQQFGTNYLLVEGWFSDVSLGRNREDDSFVALAGPDGVVMYVRTRSAPRNDVKAGLKNPGMPDAGYNARMDVTGMRGEYKIGLVRGYGGRLEVCTPFEVRLVID